MSAKTPRSAAYRRWVGARSRALDELPAAHAAIGGPKRGRRYVTQQVNQAYAMLLVAQFQGFCRDLHREAVEALLTEVPASCQPTMLTNLLYARKLTVGNPNAGHVGADFNRLGLDFWSTIYDHHAGTRAAKLELDRLCEWRNAIAHQDFDPAKLGGTILRLAQVAAWRVACKRLARSFDAVLRTHLAGLTNRPPW